MTALREHFPSIFRLHIYIFFMWRRSWLNYRATKLYFSSFLKLHFCVSCSKCHLLYTMLRKEETKDEAGQGKREKKTFSTFALPLSPWCKNVGIKFHIKYDEWEEAEAGGRVSRLAYFIFWVFLYLRQKQSAKYFRCTGTHSLFLYAFSSVFIISILFFFPPPALFPFGSVFFFYFIIFFYLDFRTPECNFATIVVRTYEYV